MAEIVGSIDVAQIILYAFWIFFAGLIWYLQAESRREGYPLEDDVTGAYNKDPWLQMPGAKTFKLPNGMGERTFPDAANRDTRPIAALRASPLHGSPLIPTGNPLVDGVGPAAWAERPDHPDLMVHGTPKIVPIDKAAGFKVLDTDKDPRGMDVRAADGVIIGQISDIWVDQMESFIRYFEVTFGEHKRLIPMHFANRASALRGRGTVYHVHALTSEKFADVPQIASADQITMLEEEKLMGYFGGGTLYGAPGREEPLL